MRDYNVRLMNGPVDVSEEFGKLENAYFIASRMTGFEEKTCAGTLEWKRSARKVRYSFNQYTAPFEESIYWAFPPVYDGDCDYPFALSFITSRTLRLRFSMQKRMIPDQTTLMLVGEPETDSSWKVSRTVAETIYTGAYGSVKLIKEPFNLEIRDADGKLLTGTLNMVDTRCIENADPTPFSFVRRASDFKRMMALSFSLRHDEKIFGCGESFTRMDKRGQKVVLCTNDAYGVQTKELYKPVPFYMSSQGYGMFVHTSAPLTFDFGYSYDQANTIYVGDDYVDLFLFIGTPKEILSEYTALTGRSPMPPLWSFGLWMGGNSYKSEAEVRHAANKLREYRVPCDVMHIDAGWFNKEEWCSFEFSRERFPDPAGMLADLRKDGFHTSLWQLPYLTPRTKAYREAVEKGYAVLDADGNLPAEDAVIDFSNPDAVQWYQGMLEKLLTMGVEAIKTDFGEAAPYNGHYASGKSGFIEHNLYPLRYNKAAFEVTKKVTGGSIVWGRSAWAGCQRYPLYWGGDAENTDSGMAATLRGGLSLGLCGFSFWSHDIGGFVDVSPEELYKRWTAFGMLTSHSRCHGAPPKEPWYYSDEFLESFRRSVELKYRLMPYIFAQARLSSTQGYPMMRTLFFEYPGDRMAWFIEDQYMLGTDMLVAPLLDADRYHRDVYLPCGTWIDYQTGSVYEGSGWYDIAAGDVPVVILIREGAVIPHIGLAQSTDAMDWSRIELKVYGVGTCKAAGVFCLPSGEGIYELTLAADGGKLRLVEDPTDGKVEFIIVGG